jgi:hypothetical protein
VSVSVSVSVCVSVCEVQRKDAKTRDKQTLRKREREAVVEESAKTHRKASKGSPASIGTAVSRLSSIYLCSVSTPSRARVYAWIRESGT